MKRLEQIESLSPPTKTSAVGLGWRSAIRMTIWKCLSGPLPSQGRGALIVHHTDAEREWAYDRASHVGRLDKALDEAKARDWIVVHMKRDWRRVFP